ncbi:MAG: SIS domain-containing protein [Pseudomonadota bacterium]
MSDLDFIEDFFSDSLSCIERARTEIAPLIQKAATLQSQRLDAGHKILVAGNGGSAADSLHYSSELLNKYLIVRRPLPAICLNADVSALTAISNDESYDKVFSKQIEALGQPGDILVVITSSGNSPNLVQAVKAAHDADMQCIALNGKTGGELNSVLHDKDINIVVSGSLTSHVQEVHSIIIHLFCDLIDQHLFSS